MRSRSLVFLIAVFIIALPVVASADDAAAVYKSKCAMCHGPDGTGQTPTGKTMKVRDLSSDDVQKAKDEELEKIIENGKNKMPAYKGKIDEKTIDGLIKVIREFAKKK
ncbi:MAG TPA: cytochrome c [Thermoanaerobaculia bacterium]|jgi:mono/diheme cytochrome c family protein